MMEMGGSKAIMYPQSVINADKYVFSNKGKHDAGNNQAFYLRDSNNKLKNV